MRSHRGSVVVDRLRPEAADCVGAPLALLEVRRPVTRDRGAARPHGKGGFAWILSETGGADQSGGDLMDSVPRTLAAAEGQESAACQPASLLSPPQVAPGRAYEMIENSTTPTLETTPNVCPTPSR